MTALMRIVELLDGKLNVQAFQDDSNDGLQNLGSIRRVCVGVDASMAFFEKAAERKADLLICHHGLSWGSKECSRRVFPMMPSSTECTACSGTPWGQWTSGRRPSERSR